MRDQVQDVWEDLRARRLWPVALVLAIAIVAVPAVMMKSSTTPASAPVASTSSATEAPGIDVEVAEIAGGGSGSTLGTLDERNPFRPPPDVMAGGESDSASASASTAGPSPAADQGSDGAPSGGAPDDGASPGGGGGSPDGGGGDVPVVPPEPPRSVSYEYVVDVTFWNGDRRSSRRGLRKLDMLPNQTSPVLIFMGTKDEGGNAVFLVDATLETTGEGTCRPSRANCVYVDIGPGAQQMFTSEDGGSYQLRVDEVRRVKAGRRARPSARSRTSAARRVAGDGEAPGRSFTLPSLVDLVVETERGTVSSDPEGGRQQ